MTALAGERVRTLRLLLGLTQQQLAVSSGVSQALISQIESGRRAPTEVVLQQIADATGANERFFQVHSTDLPVGSLRFRKFAGSRATETQRVEELTKEAWRVFSVMMECIDYPKPQLPVLRRGDGDFDLEDLASQTRTSLGLDPDRPISHLTRTVEHHGIAVIPMVLPSLEDDAGAAIGHFGVSCWPSRLDYGLIAVMSGSGDRERFTIAHEIAHMVLHTNRPVIEAEEEAHRFAGALLLPAARMHEAMSSAPVTLSDLASLKARWGVSIQALIMRGTHLGLIDESRKVSLFKQLSARRWRTNEPVNVVHEVPVLAHRLLTKLYGKHPYQQASLDLGALPLVMRGWAPNSA